MELVTLDEIMKLFKNPTQDCEKQMKELIGKGKTLHEICDLDIHIKDKIKILLFGFKAIPRRKLISIALDLAQFAISQYKDASTDYETKLQQAMSLIRQYLDNNGTKDDVKKARQISSAISNTEWNKQVLTIACHEYEMAYSHYHIRASYAARAVFLIARGILKNTPKSFVLSIDDAQHAARVINGADDFVMSKIRSGIIKKKKVRAINQNFINELFS